MQFNDGGTCRRDDHFVGVVHKTAVPSWYSACCEQPISKIGTRSELPDKIAAKRDLWIESVILRLRDFDAQTHEHQLDAGNY